MSILILTLLLQSQANPFEKYRAAAQTETVEQLGPGAHTLVISDGSAITRMEYKTGPACQKARDEVRRQATPQTRPGVIYGLPRIQAVCVPR